MNALKTACSHSPDRIRRRGGSGHCRALRRRDPARVARGLVRGRAVPRVPLGRAVGGVHAARIGRDACALGECYAVDLRADPGKTYEYRFDLYWSDGAIASYGPYTVTVPDPPLAVRLWPNPQRAAAMVEFTLPGSRWADPAFAEARVLDARGRTGACACCQSGILYRGTTRVSWDGKDAAGKRLVPGAYFVRVNGPLGTAVSRFVSL